MPELFRLWVVITHLLNILFVLVARSRMEVLSASPKFSWHEDRPPGRQWRRLPKTMYTAGSRKAWSHWKRRSRGHR